MLKLLAFLEKIYNVALLKEKRKEMSNFVRIALEIRIAVLSMSFPKLNIERKAVIKKYFKKIN